MQDSDAVQKFSETVAVGKLSDAIFTAARAVAEPVQQMIAASSQRDREVKWMATAYESLSFYIIIVSLTTQINGVAHTQATLLRNALILLVLPGLWARFLSRNPIEIQEQMFIYFMQGHSQAEINYSGCRAIFPRGHEYDQDSIVSRFAYRLIEISGNDADNKGILASIFASIQSPEGIPKISQLVNDVCSTFPPEISS